MSRMFMRRIALVWMVVLMSLVPMLGLAQGGEGDVAIDLEVIGIDACDHYRAPLIFTVKAFNMSSGEAFTTTMMPWMSTCQGDATEVFTLPAGVYSLQVSAKEFETVGQQIEVTGGSRSVIPMSISYHANPTVSVYLATEGGPSCNDEWSYQLGTLTVIDQYWQMVYSNEVASICGEHLAHRFRIPAGAYTARITVPGYDAAERSFVVEPGGSPSVSFQLASGTTSTLSDHEGNWVSDEGFTEY